MLAKRYGRLPVSIPEMAEFFFAVDTKLKIQIFAIKISGSILVPVFWISFFNWLHLRAKFENLCR
jgi:hypothetical protein